MSALWTASLREFGWNAAPRHLSMFGLVDARSRLVLAIEIVDTGRGPDLLEAMGHAVVANGVPEAIGFGEGEGALREGLAEALAADRAPRTGHPPDGLDAVTFCQLFRKHYWNPDPRVHELTFRGSRSRLERWRELQLKPPGYGISLHAG